MTAWAAAAIVLAAIGVAVLAAFLAGRYLAAQRQAREAAGERPLDDPEHLPPLEAPAEYSPRAWLIVGARVVHDEHGLGTVVTSSVASGLVGVTFDDGAGRWVAPHRLDPITPADERLYRAVVARRPSVAHLLPAPREDHQK